MKRGRPRIVDEFTNLDITPQARWVLRHLDKCASIKRAWAFNNPDKIDAANKKASNKKKLKQIVESHSLSDQMIAKKGGIGASYRNDILRLHSKGKDIGTIAIYTNLPCSKVAKVIADYAV